MRARRGSRTRSGRLKVAERRRRLQEADQGDGRTIILDVSRRRSRGQRSRGSWHVDLAVSTQFSVDLDVRKLVHRIRIELAEHYRASLLAGRTPDGKPLPKLKREPGRDWGVESGFLAENWLVFPIRGGPFAASATLKPNGRDGRSHMINRNLRRGIDLQSVRGEAAEVIRRTTDAWLQGAVPASGDGVGTPARVPKGGGTLPQLRRKT